MSTARFIIGDSLTVLRSLPDASVDLVLTSPPYLSLRSYLPADHPDKAKELGSEPTPADFVDALLDVVEECRRVLAPHGSLCMELGDTYSGLGGAGGDYNAAGLREGQQKFSGPVWPFDKSLAMIPESVRWALAYGHNPFNGRPTPRWRVRNVVRHFRPNPPVGALGDKVRPATSDWLVACAGGSRFFDLDAVRQRNERTTEVVKQSAKRMGREVPGSGPESKQLGDVLENNPNGAPPLDWWADDDLEWRDAAGFIAPTFGYPGAHYATFSPSVVKRLILPMCPERVCRTCGKPSERIVDATRNVVMGRQPLPSQVAQAGAGRSTGYFESARHEPMTTYITTGWTDCGHDDWRPGVVLDPFAGSGTTLAVATGHGRDALGIDLDARNADLAQARVGMFLTVEDAAPTLPT